MAIEFLQNLCKAAFNTHQNKLAQNQNKLPLKISYQTFFIAI